jgi:predicted metal-dependent RNase
MKVRMLGAAGGHVTGSGTYFETETARVLVDFGQFQGGAEGGELNRLPDDLDVGRLSAVVLTHGEEQSRQALSEDVARRFGLEALVPALGESFSL